MRPSLSLLPFGVQADAHEVQKLRERKAAAEAALQAAMPRLRAAKDAAVRAEEAFARGAGTKAAMDVRGSPRIALAICPSGHSRSHVSSSNQAALASRASVQAAVEQAERTLAAANSALLAAQAGPHAGQAAARKCAARCLLFAPQSGQAVRCVLSQQSIPLQACQG